MNITSKLLENKTVAFSQVDWDAVFSDWQQSGLSRAEYARRHNLKQSRFSYQMRKRLASSESPVDFLPVQVTPSASSDGSSLVFCLKYGQFQVDLKLGW